MNSETGIVDDAPLTSWGIRIPMRDGVLLNGTLYTPRDGRVGPAIVSITPYISQTFHDRGLYFAREGYGFLIVDSRGRGNSEGRFESHLNEGPDGHDVIEWVAAQPWCNGDVGMWGGSYGGYNQWMTAAEQPPHLRTIVPVASPYFGFDFPLRNVMPSPYVMQWLTLVWGRASQADIFYDQAYWNGRFADWRCTGRAFRELDDFLGLLSPSFQTWIANISIPEFWTDYNPSAEAYLLHRLPTLTITGIYDGDQPGALRHYRNHLAAGGGQGEAEHILVIGPWDHGGTRTPATRFNGIEVGPASLVDMNALHRDWYRYIMLGGPRPAFLANRVVYYVMVADCWRSASSLEAVTAFTRDLFLSPCGEGGDGSTYGRLSEDAPARAASNHYVYDPRDLSLVDLERRIDPEDIVDERMFVARAGRQLVYHSAPVEEAFELSGFVALELWLAIDQPDTDVRVALYDVDEQGRATLVTSDTQRARNRGGAVGTLVRTADPLRYRFDQFPFVSRWITTGHQLRLVVGPMNSIHDQWNMNAGGDLFAETVNDARPVIVTLHGGPGHPSRLYIPIARQCDAMSGEGAAIAMRRPV